eukprot:40421-Rhodomonas_salina.1
MEGFMAKDEDATSKLFADMLVWEVSGDTPPQAETRVYDERGALQVSRAQLPSMVMNKATRLAVHGLVEVQRPVWDGSSGADERLAIESVGIVFASYYCDSWFFEIWEFIRKFAMTALIGVIYPGSVEQTQAALVITTIALVINVQLKPRVSGVLQGMQTHALSNLVYILFFGLLLHTDQIAENPSSALTKDLLFGLEVIAILLCFTVVLFPFIAVFAVLPLLAAWRTGKQTDEASNQPVWRVHDEMVTVLLAQRMLSAESSKQDDSDVSGSIHSLTSEGNLNTDRKPRLGGKSPTVSPTAKHNLPAAEGSTRHLTREQSAQLPVQEDGMWTPDP